MWKNRAVAEFRYPQFCALARAAEVVGERWTLLVLRELTWGPRRFCDLRRHLCGVSSSVLTERLERLLRRGVVQRRQLEPPAASSVYELTESGRALGPALEAPTRWGARYLDAPKPGDQLEPEWVGLGMRALARKGPTPPRSYALRVRGAEREVALRVTGGPEGTAVVAGRGDADLTLCAEPLVFLALVSGRLDPGQAVASGQLSVEGDVEALAALPELFDFDTDSIGSEPLGSDPH